MEDGMLLPAPRMSDRVNRILTYSTMITFLSILLIRKFEESSQLVATTGPKGVEGGRNGPHEYSPMVCRGSGSQ
jgi:hypothetical protein